MDEKTLVPLLVRVQQVSREAMGAAGLEQMERENDGSGPEAK